MRLPQAPTAPPAPTAPQAPTTTTSAPPSPEQLQQQIREQVRKSVEDARTAARQARIADAKAKEQGQSAPIIVDGTGTMVPPTWPQIQNTVENVAGYFFIAVCVIAIGVPLVRALGRRLGPAPIAPPLPREVADQLRRIEQTVESMAIEIERISESQRFLTKLGAGKAEGASLPPRAGA